MTGEKGDPRDEGPLADRDPWPVLESRVEYDTGWYDGGYDRVEQPDGTAKRYYWAALDPAVVVVPLLDDEVVFVEQYRPAIRAHSLELPAGIVEPVTGDEGRPGAREPDGPSTRGVDGGDAFEAITERGRESYAAAGRRELREETGYDAAAVETLETCWCATGVLRHRRGYVVATDLEQVGRDLDENEFLSVTTRPREDALETAREPPVDDATLEALLLAAADGYL
ncbi:MAG: NUDIX hydrolase [Halobacteriaceae archaeon]